MMANASEILLLAATRHQGLANHSLRIHLGRAAGNFSINVANSVGVTTASLLPPGLLDARVELPLLGVAVGAALALVTLLGLGSCVACLACRRAKPAPGEVRAGPSSPLSRCSRCSGSEHLQPQGARLPRQTRSLPPDLRLDDLAQEAGGKTPRCRCRGTCGATGPAAARARCPSSHPFPSPQLPPRMWEPVAGERRAACPGWRPPCHGWRPPWSSASWVLSSSPRPGASTKCRA
ncbi:transmembrane protein 25 isoform X2 [Chroicocephalus ridibundus]|uniref:transmembrane protein 25 isoform X2 n=1 Tax=Chroicocephalus ridibundus TaxID=1192867 RepID=UPI002FDE298B